MSVLISQMTPAPTASITAPMVKPSIAFRHMLIARSCVVSRNRRSPELLSYSAKK
jgi:hypothetical protein